MAWQAPKTNWTGADGVRNTDLNRIEGNILDLHNTVMMQADATVFVRVTGNDSTGTGSSSSPFATVTKALDTICKNLNGKTIEIDIGAGTYAESVTIKGFSGVLQLYASGVVNVQSMVVEDCSIYQYGSQINFPRGLTLDRGTTWTGQSIIYIGGPVSTGISVLNGSVFVQYNTVTVSNATSVGFEASGGGIVYASTIAGTGNNVGLRADTGGTICYGSASISGTTQRFTNTGGRIYTGAQTSVPNY